jgi:asparagine synthase (glutamine-hydrolysing)
VGSAVLGHRRLAILDLDPISNQPMSDTQARWWITFNGEIYNYIELRRELEYRGAHFRTHGDTEVILEAWKAWGENALERLNGMFAFALYDSREDELILARDRMGEKPLYYFDLPDGGVIFASELQAMLEEPTIPRRMHMPAVKDVLSINYVLGDHSIVTGVHRLPPATMRRYRRGHAPRSHAYWSLADSFRRPPPRMGMTEAGEQLLELLQDAISLRTRADVPLGVMLSSGIDSGAIAAGMQRNGTRTRSFTIGFDEAGFDERKQARVTAELLGCEHTDSLVHAEHLADFETIVAAADEPFADSSFLPMYYLSKMTRQSVTVALGGDGGDEIFGGYETYSADQLLPFARAIPAALRRSALWAIETFIPAGQGKVPWDYKLRQFLTGVSLPADEAHYHWREVGDASYLDRILTPDAAAYTVDYRSKDVFLRHAKDVQDLSPLKRFQYVDAKTWLCDDILHKVDRASMAHALEVRAPLLDYRLVEFIAALPDEWKTKFMRRKILLRHALQAWLPKSIVNRRKQGFNAPLVHWDQQLAAVLPRVILDGAIDPSVVRALQDEHSARRRDNSLKLFALASLAVWHDKVLKSPRKAAVA